MILLEHMAAKLVYIDGFQSQCQRTDRYQDANKDEMEHGVAKLPKKGKYAV